MALWRIVNTILSYFPAILQWLREISADLKAIRTEQIRQGAMLDKILANVQPEEATKLIFTLGKPIKQ